jgi:hypothetical protein
MIRLLITLCLVGGTAAADPDTPAPATKPSSGKPNVVDLGDGKYKVGLVTLDKASRHISFPAEINMDEGLLEYAIVHENGKIHEALLHTKTSPLHINLALKLLRYKGSEELFQILDEDYKPTGRYPVVSEELKTASRVELLLSWNRTGGKAGKATLNELITNTRTAQPVAATPWIYGGSYLHEGSFAAETTGDIAAIYTSRASLFNYPGKDREDDTVWIPTPKRTPPVGTRITVTITPIAPTSK